VHSESESQGLPRVLAFVLSEVDPSLPRLYKWHLPVKRLLRMVINGSSRVRQVF